MAVIEAASAEAWKRPFLTNVTRVTKTATTVVYPRVMNADRTIVYGGVGSKLQQSVDFGVTWTDVRDFGAAGGVKGVWRLPNGEMLVSTKVGSGAGQLLVSTGFPASATGATWASVVTCSRNDNYIHDAWGFGMAPAGHVREGLVVVGEYGPQGQAGDADALMNKVWLSTDYGKTFRQIFSLHTLGKASMHLHGVTYDPYDDRVLITYGDGNGSGAQTGISYTDNFLDATPTWSYAYGPVPNGGFQATGMLPTANGILLGGDGYPPGIYRLPRRGYRQYGPLQVVLNYGGGTDTGYIGQTMFQHAPGFPIFLGREYTKTEKNPISIDGSLDGTSFFELWRDPTGRDITQYPYMYLIGPMANGQVIGVSKDYRAPAPSVWDQLTADYVQP